MDPVRFVDEEDKGGRIDGSLGGVHEFDPNAAFLGWGMAADGITHELIQLAGGDSLVAGFVHLFDPFLRLCSRADRLGG